MITISSKSAVGILSLARSDIQSRYPSASPTVSPTVSPFRVHERVQGLFYEAKLLIPRPIEPQDVKSVRAAKISDLVEKAEVLIKLYKLPENLNCESDRRYLREIIQELKLTDKGKLLHLIGRIESLAESTRQVSRSSFSIEAIASWIKLLDNAVSQIEKFPFQEKDIFYLLERLYLSSCEIEFYARNKNLPAFEEVVANLQRIQNKVDSLYNTKNIQFVINQATFASSNQEVKSSTWKNKWSMFKKRIWNSSVNAKNYLLKYIIANIPNARGMTSQQSRNNTEA